MSNKVYKDLAAFHPGYYVQDIIDDMEITQSEFAKRLNTTDKTLSQLLAGKISLSVDLANKLSQMTGTSVAMWLNLQAQYDEKVLEIERRQQLDEECEVLQQIDLPYLYGLGILQKNSTREEKVQTLCSCLNVASLKAMRQPDLLTACRTNIHDINPQNVLNANVWIQLGLNFARKEECTPFDKAKLTGSIEKLCRLSCEPLNTAFPQIKKILNDCGIALVALPYLKNSGLSGAVKWLNKDKVMLLLNDRGRDAGKFWFTLLHELRHIMQKRVTAVYLSARTAVNAEILSLGRNDAAEEEDADRFAQEALIPAKEYQAFKATRPLTVASIKHFAQSIHRSPAIVHGRLQKDEIISWSRFNKELREGYQFVVS